MHASVMAWVGATLTQADITGRSVLEVGSYDVNGTVRPIVEALEPANYLGVDQAPGPGVDRVLDAARLAELGEGTFDVVLSLEMLEHASDWQRCMYAMSTVLAPEGLLLLTTRSPGFGYHAFPEDHWRFTVPVMRDILAVLDLEQEQVTSDPDPKSPGVFARAAKPARWRPDLPALLDLDADPAPRP